MKICVVIAAYNAEKWIGRTLESALQQTMPVDIVVVDDCSTDGTAKVVQAYPVTYIKHERNKRQGAALNTGIEHVVNRCDYIAFLDADDIWQPTKIEKCVRALEVSPNAVLAYTNGHNIGPDGTRYLPLIAPGHKAMTTDHLLLNPEIGPSQVVVRGDTQQRFNEKIVANDHEFFLHLRERGPFVYIDECLSDYRLHPGQMSRSRRMWEDGLGILRRTWLRNRSKYRLSTFVKRLAVICYRLGEHDLKNGKKWRTLPYWAVSAALDPVRAFKVVVLRQ